MKKLVISGHYKKLGCAGTADINHLPGLCTGGAASTLQLSLMFLPWSKIDPCETGILGKEQEPQVKEAEARSCFQYSKIYIAPLLLRKLWLTWRCSGLCLHPPTPCCEVLQYLGAPSKWKRTSWPLPSWLSMQVSQLSFYVAISSKSKGSLLEEGSWRLKKSTKFTRCCAAPRLPKQ